MFPEMRIQLQPKQRDLERLVETPGIVNVGYGGPRGGGKSRGIRDVMLLRRFKYPNTVGWIVRRLFGDVWENHIAKYFEERPYMRQWYRASSREFVLPNGSAIKAKYAEHEGDLERTEYGKEAMDIFVDQGEQFTEKEMNFLRTCRRTPGIPDGQCKLVATINSGGRSHAYNKRVFIDKLYIENEVPESFGFVLASGWDNVEWVKEALAHDGLTPKDFYSWPEDRRFQYFITRSQYGRDLNALPENDRIRQLLGKWDFFEGQVFGELSRVHDLSSYFNVNDDKAWCDFHSGMRIIGSLDHASTGVTSYGLTGIDQDENEFQLCEHYKRNQLISEHAEMIKRLKRNYKTPDYEVIDPSTEAKTLQNSHFDKTTSAALYSVQDAYSRLGLHFVSAHRNSIAVGIDRLKELLKVDPLHRNPFTQERGSPRMFICRSRCPDLWRELTELRIVDGEYVGSDHSVDRIRYVAMSRPQAAQPTEEERNTAALAAMGKVTTWDRMKVASEKRFREEWHRAHVGSDTWY